MLLNLHSVMDFANSSRKEKAPELMFQLMQHHMQTQKPQLKLVEETKLLEQENKNLKRKLEERPEKILAMSSQVNRKLIHENRKQLAEMGMCEMNFKMVRHYRFPVTELGLESGQME